MSRQTYDMRAIPAAVTASSYYSGQPPEYAFDSGTSTYWRANTPAESWIQAELPAPVAITRLRLYQGSASYRIVNFTLQGSDDGVTFSAVYSGTLPSTVAWYAFDFPNSTAYKYYRIYADSYNSRVYLYEAEFWYTREYVKPDGMYLGISFSEALTGDVTGYNPPVGYSYKNPGNVAVSSQYSASYPGTNLVDGSLTTYWRPSTAAGSWMQCAVGTVCTGFRWYIGSSSYYPLTFTVSGSDDGETWTDIYNDTNPAGTGWKEYTFANATLYAYYRITVNTSSSTILYIYELELMLPHGNEKAITIAGQEWTYTPGGTLTDILYAVQSVAPHPTEENAILLEVAPLQRFNSAVGELSVLYDSDVGNLAGLGGPVESFELTFLPEDLIAKPHPHDPENIEITDIDAEGMLLRVYYSDTKAEERIEIANITAEGTLTHIDDI